MNENLFPMADVGRKAVQNYYCLAALIVIVWDYLDTISDEVKHIWPRRLRQPKVTYMVARYGGIIVQLAVVMFSFVSGIAGGVGTMSQRSCRKWFILQTIGSYTLYINGNIHLMMRVYRLYRSRMVLLLLLVMFFSEYSITPVFWKRGLDTLVFDGQCNGVHLDPCAFAVLTFIVCNQCLIWTLTYAKLRHGSVSLNHINTIDVGKWTWLVLYVLMLVLVPLSYIHQYLRPDLVFSWPITILSVGTCRLVLGTEKVTSHLSRTQPRALELSARRRHSKNYTAHPKPSYDTAASRVAVQSISHIAAPHEDAVSISHLTPTSAPIARNANYGVEWDSDGSRLGTSTDSAFDYQLNSGGNIEIGSAHTSSSMDSHELRVYWAEVWNDPSCA